MGRRFQFSLKWLLALTTLCAIAFWVYWIAWPAWCDYRERMAFEVPARTLRAGMTLREIKAVFGDKYDCQYYGHANGQHAAVLPVYLRTNSACVFMILKQTNQEAIQAALESDANPGTGLDPLDLPTREVYVYRLKTAPHNYHARAARSRAVARLLAERKRRERLTERWKSESGTAERIDGLEELEKLQVPVFKGVKKAFGDILERVGKTVKD